MGRCSQRRVREQPCKQLRTSLSRPGHEARCPVRRPQQPCGSPRSNCSHSAALPRPGEANARAGQSASTQRDDHDNAVRNNTTEGSEGRGPMPFRLCQHDGRLRDLVQSTRGRAHGIPPSVSGPGSIYESITQSIRTRVIFSTLRANAGAKKSPTLALCPAGRRGYPGVPLTPARHLGGTIKVFISLDSLNWPSSVHWV